MPARPLKILLLSSAVALGISAPAHAAAPSTAVVKVVDGNTVKVREGKRTRSVDLLGLDGPACHAAQAKAALAKLLPPRPASASSRMAPARAATSTAAARSSTPRCCAPGPPQGKDLAAAQAGCGS